MDYDTAAQSIGNSARVQSGLQRAYVGDVALNGAPACASEIGDIIGRVHRAAEAADKIGALLCEHANRLYGELPPTAPGGGPLPCRSGQLGALQDALDRLDRAQGFLAEQAGRNSTLA